ncbi:MAG: Ig-like domain-containing protein, partial [Candidatus Thermoplasmatota archaeon]
MSERVRQRGKRPRGPAVLAVALLLLAVGTSLVSRAPPVSITIPYSATPVGDPDLDGNPATGAWGDALATVVPLENAEAAPYGSATLYAKHDSANLFLRLDGSIDVPWTSAASNRFWIGFVISPTGTSHHGAGTWDGAFFGLWDGTDYAPQPAYPPRVVDTTGFDRPPIQDGNQNAVGFMRYSGAAAPYGFTAEWRRPLNSGDAEDLTYTADGVATYNFFVTSDSDGGGSQGGNIRHKQVTNLNTLKLAPATSPNTAPTIDLTTPDGGEAWTGGTAHTIRWNMSDAETAVTGLRVWLNYSLNNGASYSPIAGAQGLTGLTCPCTYAWTTPAADSATALVRATVVDGGGMSATDASVAVFAIDSTRPTITGTIPLNGATGVSPLTTVQVTFSEPMNRASAELAFSLQRMDTMAYLGGTYSWAGATFTFTPSAALPQAVTFTGRVNASALDASDPGNGMASPYTFSFATVDASPPTIASAAIPALQESGGSVNITATVTDNVGVTGVWTEVRDPGGGLLGNFTMAWDGGGYYYSAVYRTTGTYTFRVVARDAAGNWAEDPGTFVVRDTTPPSITHTPPAGAAVGIPIPLQASVSDNDAVAQVRVNYTDVLGATTNATMTLSGPFYAYTIPGQPAVGTVTYFVWAADPSGNAARTALYSVPVFASDATPPTISAVAANPPVQDVPGPVNVTADVTDNVAVATVYLDVTDPLGAPVGNFSMARVGLSDTYSAERPYLVLGAYSFVVWAEDTSGNVASATGGFSVVDRIAPAIVSTSAAPDPQQVGLPVDFAAQVTDNGPIDRVTIDITDPVGTPLGNFTMTLVGGNYTYASAFGAIGLHTFVVWAVDLGGNPASAGGQFTIRDVDSTPPTISAVAATPPIQDVPGPVNVTADVTDNVAVATVYL